MIDDRIEVLRNQFPDLIFSDFVVDNYKDFREESLSIQKFFVFSDLIWYSFKEIHKIFFSASFWSINYYDAWNFWISWLT